MIGTLIGMVQMFANMTDPSKLGPFMAVALLATFYGAVVANMFCLPIADKLHLKLVDEEINRTLIIDGILMIREAKSPTWCARCCSPICPRSIATHEDDEEAEPVGGLTARIHAWPRRKKRTAAATAGSSPSPTSWACW